MPGNRSAVLLAQEEYLLRGRNALETSIELAENWLEKGRRRLRSFDPVHQVIATLDRHHVPYAVIGGLAVAHHAVPRVTTDMDLIVPQEQAGRLPVLFPGCYRGATGVVETYQVGDARVDVLPATWPYQRAAVEAAIGADIRGTRVKVAAVRDLVLLKMVATPHRPHLGARRNDEAEVTSLLRISSTEYSAADIQYVGDRLLELAFAGEERTQALRQIAWLNDTLTQLGMADRCYPLPA